MKYRLFILGFLAFLFGTQALIWWLLYPVSPLLALVVSVVVFLGGTAMAHSNFNRLTAWLVSQEDRFFLNCIEAGVNPYAERRLYRLLPSDPRCRLCLVPFGGVGKALHITPSQKNPNFCKGCIESAPFGVEDIDCGILFADIRGYTEWSEHHAPHEATERVSAFYRLANRVFTRDDALVQFIGDQVMAIYLPLFPSLGERTQSVMIASAQRFLREVAKLHPGGANDTVGVGCGIHFGLASVGNVGDTYQKDFTAMGDVVNTAARLQACARAGQVVVSEIAYAPAAHQFPEAKSASFEVKGKAKPVEARILEVR